MNMLVFEGGVVKPSRLAEAQGWLSQNEAELRSSAPEGTTYLGVYAPIFSADKYPTEVFVVYSVEKYGDLDRLAASSESRFGELMGDWEEFLDDDPGLTMTKLLYKSLTAATIWGDDKN